MHDIEKKLDDVTVKFASIIGGQGNKKISQSKPRVNFWKTIVC